MKAFLIPTLTALLCISGPVTADDTSILDAWEADRTQVFDAKDVDPEAFLWQARAIVVFGESPNDPQYVIEKYVQLTFYHVCPKNGQEVCLHRVIGLCIEGTIA